MSRLFETTTFTSLVHPATPHRYGKKWQPHRMKLSHMARRWLSSWRHPVVLITGGWFALWAWNSSVAVAIALGMVSAVWVYLAQIQRLHVTWLSSPPPSPLHQRGQGLLRWAMQWGTSCGQSLYQIGLRLWRPTNQPLTLSVLSGLVAIGVVSTITLTYQTSHSLGLAGIMGLQSVAIASLTALYAWHQRRSSTVPTPEQSDSEPSASTQETIFPSRADIDRLWIDLSSTDATLRLIAIYRASNWRTAPAAAMAGASTESGSTGSGRSTFEHSTFEQAAFERQLMACFRLMLSNETHPALRQALQDSLMQLQR